MCSACCVHVYVYSVSTNTYTHVIPIIMLDLESLNAMTLETSHCLAMRFDDASITQCGGTPPGRIQILILIFVNIQSYFLANWVNYIQTLVYLDFCHYYHLEIQYQVAYQDGRKYYCKRLDHIRQVQSRNEDNYLGKCKASKDFQNRYANCNTKIAISLLFF